MNSGATNGHNAYSQPAATREITNPDIVDRPRRLRSTSAIRSLVRETRVSPRDCVLPLFIRAGHGIVQPIASMRGHSQQSVDQLPEELDDILSAELGAVLLFGIPDSKDDTGSSAWDARGPVPQAAAAIKRLSPDTVVIADVCLCEYTSHGHCGALRNQSVQNDETLELLGRAAVAYADAGADIIAPSAMMDGQVAAIRSALDDAGHTSVPIMAYAAKYASAFYGPFRDAAGSTPSFGDRRAYQMDPPNAREALREVALDLQEGADIIMVKPAGAYLDILRQVRDVMDRPLAAYQVSGEFAMIVAAAERGWIDEERAAMESLTAIKRAGADIIITYFAKQVSAWSARNS
ncbi:MAG: porphobilinogen synthase [Phycisphaerae bacterium]|nr:porphobilinogen synthase [Gemmatimonadaceae bacterium]